MNNIFHLNKKEITCWLWGLVGLVLSFSPLLFNFIWGNHDWMPVIADNSLTAGLIEGRFTQYIFLNLFLSGKILPVLNILLGFLCYALALTLLYFRFFKLDNFTPKNIFVIMAIATLPYSTEILYFHFISFSLLCWPLIIVLALLAAQKPSFSNIFISTLLLFFAIGGYPAAAGMYVVAVTLYTIQNLPTSKSIKQVICKIFPFAVAFVFAFLPLPLIYSWLKKENLMIPLYNTEPENLQNLITKIPATISSSLQSLFQTQPFFPVPFKILTGFIVLMLIIAFLQKCYKKHRTLVGIVLTLFLLLVLKFPAWLSHESSENYFAPYDPAAFMVRTDFYIIPCLLLFSFGYLLQTKQIWLKNVLFAITLILLWLNLTLNLTFSKTHLLGFTAENLLLQRITQRFQEHPDFNPSQLYRITQIGELPLRGKYYQQHPAEKYGYYTLQVPYTRYWIASEYYNFYAPQNFAVDSIPLTPSAQMSEYITTRLAPWPSVNSIYLEKENALVVLSADGLKLFMSQFNNLPKTAQ